MCGTPSSDLHVGSELSKQGDKAEAGRRWSMFEIFGRPGGIGTRLGCRRCNPFEPGLWGELQKMKICCRGKSECLEQDEVAFCAEASRKEEDLAPHHLLREHFEVVDLKARIHARLGCRPPEKRASGRRGVWIETQSPRPGQWRPRNPLQSARVRMQNRPMSGGPSAAGLRWSARWLKDAMRFVCAGEGSAEFRRASDSQLASEG